jgi:hypothetical protein
MPIEVRISEPLLLDELIAALRRNGCLAQRVAADSCLVIHVEASHGGEARQELDFFLRAWQLRHSRVAAFVTS